MMRTKLIVLLSVFVMLGLTCFAGPWNGSGIYTVGEGGDYPNLGAFFFAMTGFRQGTGLITCTTTSNVITGSGTAFTTEVQVGDIIVCGTGGTAIQFLTVATVDTDTQLTVTINPTSAVTNGNFEIYRAPASAVTGDVVVEVISNTTEPNNIQLTVNMNGYSLTIKPGAGVKPTVTFTRPNDNNGFSGHFMIGAGIISYNEIVNLNASTIVINGSNNYTTSRDMTWVSAPATGYDWAGFVHVLGDNDNVVVKNMIMANNSPIATGINKMYFRTTQRNVPTQVTGGPITYAPVGVHKPDNWKVLNNYMSHTAGFGADQAIVVTNSGAITAPQLGCEIKDNFIRSRLRGIFLNNGGGPGWNVQRNKIIITGISAGYDHFGILINNASSPAAGTANYTDNWIEVNYPSTGATANGYGPHGIWLTSAGSGTDRIYNCFNNMVILRLTGTPATTIDYEVKGIQLSSAVRYNVYHNSVYIRPATVPGNLPADDHGIGGFGTAVAAVTDIKNNIVVSCVKNVPCINQMTLPTGAGSFTTDYNNLFADPVAEALTGRRTTSLYTTLTDWQGIGYDLNSKALDPRVPVPPTAGKWYSETDLHFCADAPQFNFATAVGVTTDIDGEKRSSYVGCDEFVTYLYVGSAYSSADSPIPPVGFNPVTSGTLVACSASDILSGGTKRICTGWTGQGAVPAAGTTNSFTYTHDQDSTVTWSWKTQYKLTTSVNLPAGGTVDPAGENWIDEGQSVLVEAFPAPGYFFIGWSGDLSGTTNPANVYMDGPKNIVANFASRDIDVNPLVLDFGQQEVCTTQTLCSIVSNVGYGLLTISEISITGIDKDFYVWSNPVSMPLLLDAGSTIPLCITFHPTDSFRYNAAEVKIVSDDPDEPEVIIPLKGSGYYLGIDDWRLLSEATTPNFRKEAWTRD